MNCSVCKVNKIGPKTPLNGGFVCGNSHLQCYDCNTKFRGHCGNCKDATQFVQMNFNSCSQSLAIEQTKIDMSAVEQPPLAPPLNRTQSNMFSVHPQSSSFLPKDVFADIETQSNLSQEHCISMRDSKESLHQNNTPIGTRTKLSKVTKETVEKSVEETLTSNEHSATNILNSANEGQTFNDQQKPNTENIFDSTITEGNSALNLGYYSHNVDNSDGLNDEHHVKVDNKKHSHRQHYDHLEPSKELGKKENIFLFEEDSKDYIHACDICFMDPSDSLQKLHSNNMSNETKTSKHEEINRNESQSPSPELRNGVNHQEALSTNALHNFETPNMANAEVMENYLRSYGPVGFFHLPTYNCQHTYCDFGWHQQQLQQHVHEMMEQKKTVCVSTDLDPSLKNIVHATKPTVTQQQFNPQDYVIMHSMGVSKPEYGNMALADKFGGPSLDMRMQKILETIQEDPKMQKIKEKPKEQMKENYRKIPTPSAVTQPLTENVSQREQQQNQNSNNSVSPAKANTNSGVLLQLLNSFRAYYNPPAQFVEPARNLHTMPQPEPVSQEPPLPQFQTIFCSSAVAQELMVTKSRYLNNQPVPACKLKILRSPIKCPESSCQHMIFVSDFSKHLVVDHSHLPMERITSYQCKNFFLDPRLAHCGISKCHMLYLLRDKISDLGSSKYKDFLPLLVMTSRISLTQICGLRQEQQESSKEFFIIWLTGIVPEEFPISVSLTIWPRSGKVPSCHRVYSGEVYSIRMSQQGLDVWQSGRMLMLSSQEIDLLTNGGKEMLNLQLVVH